MYPSEFKAAIETTLGQPLRAHLSCRRRYIGDDNETPYSKNYTVIETGVGLLQIACNSLDYHIQIVLVGAPLKPLPEGFSAEGEWNIGTKQDGPGCAEANLKTLARRLGLAGYVPPAPEPMESTPPEEPEVGSTWQHRNGLRYVVTGFTNTKTSRQDKYPRTVVYRNVETGTPYSRPLHDWHRSMTLVPAEKPEDIGLGTIGEPKLTTPPFGLLFGNAPVFTVSGSLDALGKFLVSDPEVGLPWNPMDTAPKGRGFGSPILLKKGHERILARWESGSWIAGSTGCGCGVNHDFEVENPEGWLPADHEGEPATGLPFTEVQRELMRDALNNYVLDHITKGLGGSCAVANAKDLINQLQ